MRSRRGVLLLTMALGCAGRAPPPPPVTSGVARTQPVAPPPPAEPRPATVALPPADRCPTVPLLARPRVRRPWADPSQGRCYDPALSPAVDRVPFGRDIDDALFCVAAFYEAPGALPHDAMLDGAAHELARVYPQFRVEVQSGRLTVATKKSVATVGPASNLRGLVADLLALAELARAAIPSSAIAHNGNPEHVLLVGAMGALPWQASFQPRDDAPQPPGNPALAPPRPVPASAFGPVVDGIAYLRAGRFDLGMTARFRRALSVHPELRAVVLDLRGTPGGYLSESLALADLFLRRGCVAITRTGDGSGGAVAREQAGDIDVPLAILVDRYTGAGAELVAATLRGRGRAILVGETTAGDGVIHALFDLGSGAKVHLPVAELLPADGVPFQGHGVAPDREVPRDFAAEEGLDRETSFAMRLLREQRK